MVNDEYSEVFHVGDGDCISAIDSSLPSVLGTYVIVKWMEVASAKNIRQHLGEGQITVGRAISIEHNLMVRRGEDVEIISTIQKRERREVVFAIEARSNGKTVATASHERVIIPTRLLYRIMST
ncbi:thioesterase family protein [Chlorobium sp. KB01]|uniref:thioesterase family protein n=1 Tax=Chlorobium sp. KB01 TaxID=1917528 RepID=UPI0009779F77|nr:hotdog domain-containing protein [Chlorobium sp. KB01]